MEEGAREALRGLEAGVRGFGFGLALASEEEEEGVGVEGGGEEEEESAEESEAEEEEAEEEEAEAEAEDEAEEEEEEEEEGGGAAAFFLVEGIGEDEGGWSVESERSTFGRTKGEPKREGGPSALRLGGGWWWAVRRVEGIWKDFDEEEEGGGVGVGGVGGTGIQWVGRGARKASMSRQGGFGRNVAKGGKKLASRCLSR